MTGTQRTSQTVIRRMARLAPVVLVTAIVGAVLMGWSAYSAIPELTWRGLAALKIVNYAASPTYPQPSSAVAIALQPGTRENAIEDAGARPEDVGPVSAAVNAKDAAVVDLTVTASDSETAEAVATALRSIVISSTLEPVAPNLEFTSATRDGYLTTAREMERIAAETEARLEQDPDNVELQALLVDASAQARGMSEAARNAEFQRQTWAKGVDEFGEIASEPVETTRPVLVAGIQGAVLGAIIGFLLVAAFAAYQAWREPGASAS